MPMRRPFPPSAGPAGFRARKARGWVSLALCLMLAPACQTVHEPSVPSETFGSEETSLAGVPDPRPRSTPPASAGEPLQNSTGIVVLRPAAPPVALDASGEAEESGEGAGAGEPETLLIREPWSNPVARGGVQAAEVGLEFEPVHFEYDSHALGSAARQRLLRYCDWLQEHPDVHVTLEGHCDERGSSDYNYNLGMTRAWAVKEMMVGQGIAPARLFTISYGEEQPIAMGSSSRAWALNRRVEFRPFHPTRDGRFLSTLKESPGEPPAGEGSGVPPPQPALKLDRDDAAWPPLSE